MMSDQQIDRLVGAIEAVTEPSSVLVTYAPVAIALVGTLSAIAALYSVRLARSNALAARKAIEAQMVLQSEKEYGLLTAELSFIGEYYQNGEGPKIISDFMHLSASDNWRKKLKENIVPQEDWEKARKIKTYFKSYHKLLKSNFVSEEAIVLMINHMGLNLLYDTVQHLDKHRFFYARRGREVSEDELDEEFIWLEDLKCILPAYNPRLN